MNKKEVLSAKADWLRTQNAIERRTLRHAVNTEWRVDHSLDLEKKLKASEAEVARLTKALQNVGKIASEAQAHSRLDRLLEGGEFQVQFSK